MREWNADWYSEMLREDNAPKIKMGTTNINNKNISFGIIFDRNNQYTSMVTVKKSDLQSYREFKNNDYIPIQVRVDERFIHKTLGVLRSDYDNYYVTISMYDDFINDCHNGRYLRIMLGDDKRRAAIIKFSLKGFTKTYDRATSLTHIIKNDGILI